MNGRGKIRPWSGQGCPSVASYLDFYTNIPDYSELHDLSDSEFYERLQRLKDTQKEFALDGGESGAEHSSSLSSLGSKPRKEEKTKRIVVHSPIGWGRETPVCPSPRFHHHHHHPQKDICRSLDALSINSGLHVHGEQCLKPRPRTKTDKHEVPLLSRIPLFHRIMAEQEESISDDENSSRRRIIHERNSQELRALVQPFSFTKKEEAAKQASLQKCTRRPRSRTPFKARPIPPDLFSERAYDQMHEDQFYRALRKKMRAEEMLKNAKMPPSMQARENQPKKEKSKSLDFLGSKTKRRGYRRVSTSGSETPKLGSNTDSSADISPNNSTFGPRRRRPVSNLSASRSNLASVLRTQTARSRLEAMMKKQIEEQEQQDHARFKARLLRLSPAWRTLDYNTDEDLALRLAQRREEAKRQGRNHRQLMEEIHGRVHHIPPLFQEPGRINSCGRIHRKSEPRSKSLESSFDAGRKKQRNTRKSRSFYLDRNRIKSSESSQPKSDISKESSGSDIESNICVNRRNNI